MPRSKFPAADRKPTWTSLTVQALRIADDFMNFAQLMAATGADANRMAATIHHLKEHRVIAAMDNDGVLWFYLTGEDTRTTTLGERVPEPKGNRTRGLGHKRKPKAPDA